MAVVTRLAFVSFVSRYARIQPQQAMTEVHDGVTEREGDTALESMVAAVGRLFALVFTPLLLETRLRR